MCKDAARRRNHRKLLYERQEGRCIYCGCQTLIFRGKQKKQEDSMATLEHIIPKSRGGTWKRENLAISCSVCNNTRGSIDHYLFLYPFQKRNCTVLETACQLDERIQK